MILADKIMSLRKKSGWSQEELANQLGVSRQSVSKWESTQSMPDIDKIMRMSELFGVSTDYLLKDELESPTDPAASPEPAPQVTMGSHEPENVRHISMEEASAYLDTAKATSRRFGLGVSLCVASPVLLMALIGLTRVEALALGENVAVGIGIVALLASVACGVMLLILTGMKTKKYEFLEQEALELDYGVEAVVLRRREAVSQVHGMKVAIGVGLCILSAVPLIFTAMIQNETIIMGSVALLLVLVAIAVFLFVSDGMIWGSFQKLLQEEDYTIENKRAGRKLAWLPGLYWGIVVAAFLTWSFTTNRWDQTWIIWPIAGVLFGVIYGTARALVKNRAQA